MKWNFNKEPAVLAITQLQHNIVMIWLYLHIIEIEHQIIRFYTLRKI